MQPLERLRHVLGGTAADRVPNFDIFMARAAHHIGARLSTYYLDHRVLCAANLAVLEDFHLDIVQAISDPYREAADTGLQVEFPDDGLPGNRTPLIADPGDLGRITFPVSAFGPRMTDRLEAIRKLHEAVGADVPVMGWVEGALAEAADLRGVGNLMMDLVMNPGWVKDLLERCVEVEVAFARAQVEAGATIIGLGDAVASQISPGMYREFALPYERRVFDAVRELGGVSRLHICGNTTHLLGDMARTGAEIVDIDWMVDMSRAVERFDGVVVCGNIDPVAVLLQGTPEQVRAGVRSNAAAGGTRWISAAGCEIPDGTPAVNLLAQHEALREIAAAPALAPEPDRTRPNPSV
jgi:MtaA/CmuA family methyltransferase